MTEFNWTRKADIVRVKDRRSRSWGAEGRRRGGAKGCWKQRRPHLRAGCGVGMRRDCVAGNDEAGPGLLGVSGHVKSSQT